MRIFGIAIVKNEADVIRSMLAESAGWADRIFVYDNGSSDGTWEIVQSMAGDVVVPWKSEAVPFHNNLRARVFQAFRHEAAEGDWWCYRMDADEFYLDDPREFLGRVPAQYHVVFRTSLNFVLTREDLEEYDFTGDFAADRGKLRYVEPLAKVETRFVKHRPRMVWKDEIGSRFYKGIAYPRHIRVKHYPWRSPAQVQTRLASRRDFKLDKARRKGKDLAVREHRYLAANWYEMLPSRAELLEYTGPEVFEKAALPERKMRRIHESSLSYVAKRVLHGLRVLR